MKARALILLLALPLLCVAGCQHNLVRSTPASVATPPPPVAATPPPELLTPMPAPRKVTSLQPLPPPPEIEVPTLPIPQPMPMPAAPQPAPPKGEAPLIAPQMTPAQLAGAQHQTNADIRASERNLQLTYGRTLDAAQRDLVDKIRGFLEQAHEATHANDWVRARNLAQKARILSNELINSF